MYDNTSYVIFSKIKLQLLIVKGTVCAGYSMCRVLKISNIIVNFQIVVTLLA